MLKVILCNEEWHFERVWWLHCTENVCKNIYVLKLKNKSLYEFQVDDVEVDNDGQLLPVIFL